MLEILLHNDMIVFSLTPNAKTALWAQKILNRNCDQVKIRYYSETSRIKQSVNKNEQDRKI